MPATAQLQASSLVLATSVAKLATMPVTAPLPIQMLCATAVRRQATSRVTALPPPLTGSAISARRPATLLGTALKWKTELITVMHLFPAVEVAGPAKPGGFECLKV